MAIVVWVFPFWMRAGRGHIVLRKNRAKIGNPGFSLPSSPMIEDEEEASLICSLPHRPPAGYLFNNFVRGRLCANADGAGCHRIDHAGGALRVVGRRVPQVAP